MSCTSNSHIKLLNNIPDTNQENNASEDIQVLLIDDGDIQKSYFDDHILLTLLELLLDHYSIYSKTNIKVVVLPQQFSLYESSIQNLMIDLAHLNNLSKAFIDWVDDIIYCIMPSQSQILGK